MPLVLGPPEVDPRDPFVRFKTTRRALYERALARAPRGHDVILRNRRGELTESTRANLVVELDGRWWTPPASAGLLAGTYRAALLARRDIAARPLTADALRHASRVALINSVRGWIDARLAPCYNGGDEHAL